MIRVAERLGIAGLVAVWVLAAPTASEAQPADIETCATPAPPGDLPEFSFQSARKAYRRAKSLFRRGEYDQALAAIDAGVKVDPDYWRLLCLRGEILLERNQHDAALAAYEACLPKIKKRGNRRSVQRDIDDLEVVKTTFITLQADGKGPTSVYLQSKRKGVWAVVERTCRKGLLPRSYRVYVEREGFEDKRDSVTAKAGDTVPLAIDLAEKPSRLEIAATPPDATITLNGTEIGAAPWTGEVPAGEHELVVRADGYATQTVTITASRGEPVTQSLELQEVVAVALPEGVPGVRVLLDGDPVEFQGGVIAVTPGAHTLRFEAEDFEAVEVEIPAEREPGHSVPAPVMKRIERAPPPPPPPPPPPTEWNPVKLGVVGTTGGVAVLSLVLGTVQGVRASSKWSDAEALCNDSPDGVLCGDDGQPVADSARSLAAQSNQWFAISALAGLGAMTAWNWGEPPAEGRFSTRRKISLGVAAGAAIVGVGVGSFYGLRARSRQSTADDNCDDDQVCNAVGFTAAEQAIDDAGVANLGFLVAAAGAGAAAYLWLFPPSGDERPATVQVTPAVGASQVGVQVSGGF